MRSTIIIIILIFSYSRCYSQYDLCKIEFVFSQALESNPCRTANILLYRYDSLNYQIRVKVITKTRILNHIKKEIEDKTFSISKIEFTKIAEMIVNLPSQYFGDRMLDSLYVYTHPSSYTLIFKNQEGEELSYQFLNPRFNTKERRLEPFVNISLEIIKLAKIKPKYFLLD